MTLVIPSLTKNIIIFIMRFFLFLTLLFYMKFQENESYILEDNFFDFLNVDFIEMKKEIEGKISSYCQLLLD
jgi:hypothetical protein